MRIENLIICTSFFVLVLFSGCATSMNKEMIPMLDSSKYTETGKSIEVSSVFGGSTTEGLGDIITKGGMTHKDSDSPLRNSDLKYALNEGLKKAKLFTVLLPDNDADLSLTAEIKRINLPTPPIVAPQVKVEILYLLTSGPKQIIKKKIQSIHKAGAFSSFSGEGRVRIALEGAVRKNIEKIINEMAQIKNF